MGAATRRVRRRYKKAAAPALELRPRDRSAAPATPRLSGCARPQTPSSARRGRQRIHIDQETGVWFTVPGSMEHASLGGKCVAEVRSTRRRCADRCAEGGPAAIGPRSAAQSSRVALAEPPPRTSAWHPRAPRMRRPSRGSMGWPRPPVGGPARRAVGIPRSLPRPRPSCPFLKIGRARVPTRARPSGGPPGLHRPRAPLGDACAGWPGRLDGVSVNDELTVIPRSVQAGWDLRLAGPCVRPRRVGGEDGPAGRWTASLACGKGPLDPTDAARVAGGIRWTGQPEL